MDKLQSVTGMHDVLPEDSEYLSHDYLNFIKRAIRHRCRQRGIKRITTPALEYTELFKKGIGEQTDIVEKEMYTFQDQGENWLTLRPEGTAGVVRSYIEHGMLNLPQPVELYYIEPMFRRDRPQKGRFRQHFHFGVEILGESDPALDAELINLFLTIHQDLGIGDKVELLLNSLGCKICRPKYIEQLHNFYAGKERNLCEPCQARLGKNPLRLLDCKEEDCKILAQMAPKITQHLCAECAEFHTCLKEYLRELNITFTETPSLVRGQDYYTKTVFEFVIKGDDKAQNATGGGGRYDELVELLGGQSTPAVGFGMGIERVVSLMKEAGVRVPNKDTIHVFLIQLGEEAKKRSLPLLQELRSVGIKARGSFGKDSIKSQLRLADKLKVPFTLILGQLEVRDKTIILRDMQKGVQKILKLDKTLEELLKVIPKDSLDTANFSEELIRL